MAKGSTGCFDSDSLPHIQLSWVTSGSVAGLRGWSVDEGVGVGVGVGQARVNQPHSDSLR